MFDTFEFPRVSGLDYLMDEENPTTDYLFINEPHDRFSMYFERGQKPFELADDGATDKEYCLFQMKRPNRTIHFYCPERMPDRESVMWYFYVEIFDENGNPHVLPGQMRVVLADGCLRMAGGKTQFIEILENVQLTEAKNTA
jgi:hypothetical protein